MARFLFLDERRFQCFDFPNIVSAGSYRTWIEWIGEPLAKLLETNDNRRKIEQISDFLDRFLSGLAALARGQCGNVLRRVFDQLLRFVDFAFVEESVEFTFKFDKNTRACSARNEALLGYCSVATLM